MEIDVTKFAGNEEECMQDYFASRMELGQDAAKITWQACIESVEEYNFLDTEDKLQACRDHFLEYGAWTEEEINAWTDNELNAIFLQEVASSVRELEHYENYEDIEKAYEEGVISGRLYRSDDNKWYFYLGI